MNALKHFSAQFKKHGGLFIIGTDTGVGKTHVACLMARQFLAWGLDVGVFKPCQSGPEDDAGRLMKAAGVSDTGREVNPYQFRHALAPAVAARLEKRKVDLERIKKAFLVLKKRHEGVLVEGAGGLLVPLTPSQTVADLARALGLPLVVVARPGLGTINHTLLTLREARHYGLKVAGVVINRFGKKPGLAEKTSPAEIKRLGKVKVTLMG